MIEYFLIKLADGRELRVEGKVLAEKLPDTTAEELASILKTDTLENLLLKMSHQVERLKEDAISKTEHIVLQDKHIALQDEKISEHITAQEKQLVACK